MASPEPRLTGWFRLRAVTEPILRGTLVVVGIYQVGIALLMWVAPGTFFDEIGRYGVQNDHYIGDVASFNLAAGIGILLSVNRPSWRVPLLVVGAIWFELHALNHLLDIGEARTDARGILDTVVLALVGLGSAYMARESWRLQEEST